MHDEILKKRTNIWQCVKKTEEVLKKVVNINKDYYGYLYGAGQ